VLLQPRRRNCTGRP